MKIAKSRLRLGTKTVIAEARPPKGCQDTGVHVSGSNVLLDPGFETTTSVPRINDNLVGFTGAVGAWLSSPNFAADEEWTIETTDPDAGTQHAQTIMDDAGGGTVPGAWSLYPIAGFKCPENDMQPPYNFYSAIIQNGDAWDWSIRVKATAVTFDPNVFLEVDSYDADGNYLSTATSTGLYLTTSYATVSVGSTAASDGYLQARLQANKDLAGSATIRADTAILSITP